MEIDSFRLSWVFPSFCLFRYCFESSTHFYRGAYALKSFVAHRHFAMLLHIYIYIYLYIKRARSLEKQCAVYNQQAIWFIKFVGFSQSDRRRTFVSYAAVWTWTNQYMDRLTPSNVTHTFASTQFIRRCKRYTHKHDRIQC